MLMTKKIGETRGNEYIPIETSQMVNKFYDYTVSLTVFTSMLKLCRLLRSEIGLFLLSHIIILFQFPKGLSTDCSDN